MYQPEAPSKYSKPQVILSSGRLLFNAKSDSILMFASKSIGLSSAGSLNFDSDGDFIVNSPKIQLGLNASEPLLLGNTTSNVLNQIINQILKLAESLSTITGAPSGAPIVNVNTVASEALVYLKKIQAELDIIKSTQNFTR